MASRPHLSRHSWAAIVGSCLLVGLFASDSWAQGRPAIDYVVGPQDVLTVTCYDQADLTGKFTVEADGTFTYPYIGRVKAGGTTLRAIEAQLKKQLMDDGYFRNPQITVAVESYKSQKVSVIGEVRQPGSYPLSGNMSLVEVLALAGSTLPSAGGEAIVVRAGSVATGAALLIGPDENIQRVNLRDLQNGAFSENVALKDGDTILIPKAESIYVFGHVKNPSSYTLQHRDTTVLQALSLAGGVTDRGSTSRIRIIRIVNGKEQEIRAKLTDLVRPGDTVWVSERFF